MDWIFNNDMPIYTQLVAKIKLGIVSGELAPGERMMAVREFAMEAGVNPNTMQRAMQQLEREGLVYTQRSSGRYVTEDIGIIAMAKSSLAREYIREFTVSMDRLGYSADEIQDALRSSMEEHNGSNT